MSEKYDEKINHIVREIVPIIQKKVKTEKEVEDVLKMLIGFFNLQKFVNRKK